MAKQQTKSTSMNLGKKASKKESAINIGRNDITYFKNAKIICVACNTEYDAGSTLEEIRVDVCANCHPFFTGEKRLLDTQGRIEKFRKKYNLKQES